LITDEEQICLKCLCDLPYTNYHKNEHNPVEQLFTGKVHIEKATALFHFEKEGKVQQLIHSFKYHGNKELAIQLGKHMGTLLRNNNIDLLIPVPLHPRRKKKRGYNQSEMLCKGVASVWNTPINTTLLQRISNTSTQTEKSLFDRWTNTRDIFTLHDPDLFHYKHILLVDDVITSGSTLLSCAELLLTIPGSKVSLLALSVA